MSSYSPMRFLSLPPVIKNLIIINAIFFFAKIVFEQMGIDLTNLLGLHYPSSPLFKSWQFVTYMFMHGNFMHIFFNMFALYMFGNALENVWGPKRFLAFYLITGIGASIVQLLVALVRMKLFLPEPSAEQMAYIMTDGVQAILQNKNFADPFLGELNAIINAAMVGASGAVFGILLAFGMMFPNSMIYVYFAIPVKAKYFVMIYGAIELFSGFSNQTGDNVAHFAHLGGMLFGYILIKYWNKNRLNF